MFHEEALYVPLPLLNLKVILKKRPLKRCVCVCVCHLVRSAEIKRTDPFGVRLCQTRLDLFVRETVLPDVVAAAVESLMERFDGGRTLLRR